MKKSLSVRQSVSRSALKDRKTERLRDGRAQRVQAASPVLFQSQDAQGFRRISSTASGRDLTPPQHDRMQAVAYYLSAVNPIARRIIEIVKDFVVGEGIKLRANDPDVQAGLDAFWFDPVNNMDQALHENVRELGIFGELCLFVATNPISGSTRLGYIDPSRIDSVEYGTLEGLPGVAVAGARTVILRPSYASPGRASEGKRLDIIHLDEDPYSPTFGRLVGDCFYWPINKARAGTRGISDLFAGADWIDGYDQMLFAVMGQVDSLSRFIWDVTLTGMTAEQIEEWLKKHGAAPKRNTVRAHNEKVAWTAVAPHLNAADKSEAARTVKNMILGGAGFPEHWFAEGGTTNRATALEQGEPTLKMLTTRQLFVRQMIAQIADLVIDRAIAAGVLPEDVDDTFEVQTPDISVRDQAKAATALGTAMQALVQAQTVHAVDRRTIARILVLLAQPLGIELNVDDVLAAAREEENAANLADYTRNPVPAADAGAAA